MIKLTNTQFIEKFEKFYPNYDTSKTQYINSNTPITFTCPTHGDQKVITWKLFKNTQPPCVKCRKNIRVKDTTTFIQKANILHNNKYD